MILYRSRRGIILAREDRGWRVPARDWGGLINRPDLEEFLESVARRRVPLPRRFDPDRAGLLPPLDVQEVWGAGVTYSRSREARMEEARDAGGGDFYARVYDAERPEIFFKSTPHRTAGHRQEVRLRRDSRWSVPEPELALFFNREGNLAGCTVGNDMSARDIEGENPLYLPQAKIYDGSCALGPGLLVTRKFLPPATEIRMAVLRRHRPVFEGSTTLERFRRDPRALAEYLFRDNRFPGGCFLLTGTGIVPPRDFSLRPGDEIRISIGPIGTLVNFVAPKNTPRTRSPGARWKP